MNILEELDARHLVADCSNRDELSKQLASETVTLYAGYDPTSTSLHIGNLVPVIMQARLQRAGHRPIVVVGGATGMIGDPSGKSGERNLLDEDQLAHNVASIRAQLSRVIDFGDGPKDAILVNNADWTVGVDYLTFLRDYGKHLTINYMMAKDSVRARLEGDAGISYTEFSYMLLQAFDFVQLHKRHGCTLQVGGSDQWGNITAGCELQRKLGGAQLYALVAPLLLDSSGQKMGKTSTGERVWLDAELTPPYAFHQYWLNVADADAVRLLKIFSWRPLAEIDEIARAHDAEPGARHPHRALAGDMTDWIHGKAATARAVRAAQVLFGGALDDLDDAVMGELFAAVEKKLDLTAAELDAGVPIVDLLTRTGLAASKGEARRKLAEGGVYLGNQRVENADVSVTRAHLVAPSYLLARVGKKNYAVARVRD
jgi:tyrosyl-tRNA synthetase